MFVFCADGEGNVAGPFNAKVPPDVMPLNVAFRNSRPAGPPRLAVWLVDLSSGTQTVWVRHPFVKPSTDSSAAEAGATDDTPNAAAKQ